MKNRSLFIFIGGCIAGLSIAVFGSTYVLDRGVSRQGAVTIRSGDGTIRLGQTSHGSGIMDGLSESVGAAFGTSKPRVRDDHYRKSDSDSALSIDTTLDGETNGNTLNTEDIVPFDVDALTEGGGSVKSFKEIFNIFMGSK